jgi:hypothetical protein
MLYIVKKYRRWLREFGSHVLHLLLRADESQSILQNIVQVPRNIKRATSLYLFHGRAKRFAAVAGLNMRDLSACTGCEENPLKDYFLNHRHGRGIWKWNHYFDVYHRHLQPFCGRSLKVLEIGVYSGGSLGMWRDYFGDGAAIYGLDIEPACKAYEEEGVTVLIGDQGDREFWRRIKKTLPAFDIVIDDGGHLVEQQIVTFEEIFPQMSPGGVYICEDVHGVNNGFTGYIGGLIAGLNQDEEKQQDYVDPNRRLSVTASPFQAVVRSVCCYPFIIVLEI